MIRLTESRRIPAFQLNYTLPPSTEVFNYTDFIVGKNTTFILCKKGHDFCQSSIIWTYLEKEKLFGAHSISSLNIS